MYFFSHISRLSKGDFLVFITNNFIWVFLPLANWSSLFRILFVHDCLMDILDAFFRNTKFSFTHLKYFQNDLIMSGHFSNIFERLTLHIDIPYHYTALL